MSALSAFDGTKLAYDELGTGGDPVVCLPGGPMQASQYLGDLGGLSEKRRLIRLDLRGTGDSAVPEDLGSYRCDRLVDDVEALRRHLALDRMDLLAHSAGANLALLYAVRHPGRVRKLALVAPSLMATGISVSATDRREVAHLRTGEEWFPEASAALARVAADGGSAQDWERLTPFFYGRWDAAARAHKASEASGRNHEAAAIFGSEGAFDAHAVREALADFRSPTLILAGELDVNSPPSRAAELAEIFPNAELVVQPGSAHFPWLDDADRFVATTRAFLADPGAERD
ncbi:MAG: alpha/beta fold hydrolase [Nocardioidaceae bacterium]